MAAGSISDLEKPASPVTLSMDAPLNAKTCRFLGALRKQIYFGKGRRLTLFPGTPTGWPPFLQNGGRDPLLDYSLQKGRGSPQGSAWRPVSQRHKSTDVYVRRAIRENAQRRPPFSGDDPKGLGSAPR